MIRWFEHHQVYAPSRTFEGSAASLSAGFEDVYLTAQDGVRLNGWFLTVPAGSPRSHLVFLFLHGNPGNVSHRLAYYASWLELGMNVFAIDYRGYGLSEGQPGESGTYLDAQAAYAWLRQKGFPPENIIVLGKSLGGGVGSELALREPIGGLILQNSYTRIVDIASELFPWLPVRWMNTIKYDTLGKLPRIKVPLLILHSREDRFIRYHHGERNFAAGNEPKMLWEIAGDHAQTLEADRTRYLEGLDRYLRTFFQMEKDR